MGACLCKTTTSPPEPETMPPWSDLERDIGGLILRRLPSHDDRLSFSAVCQEWRLAAQQHDRMQPSSIPCINLGRGEYQSLIDGQVRCFPMPKGYHAGGSFGGWLFYYHEGSGRCFLRAPFSSGAAAIQVPTRYHMSSSVDLPLDEDKCRTLPETMLVGRGMDTKMIVCSADLVVALFGHQRQGYVHPISHLASFRPTQQHQQRLLAVWSFVVQHHDHIAMPYAYTDIAFYRGKVFALSFSEQLFSHDINGQRNHEQQQPIVEHDVSDEAHPAATPLSHCYLVVGSDEQKLFMVRCRRCITADGHWEMDLWVFEADFSKGRWSQVNDLGDQVLFLGRNCSMAFATSSTEHWGQMFRGGNRVFVLGTEWATSWGQSVSCKTRDIPSYCVYNMVSRETDFVWLDGPSYIETCTSGWFFPHNAYDACQKF